MNRDSVHVVALAALGCMLAATASVKADVDLEWRPASQTVAVGDTVDIGLYAVSDSDSPQAIGAMQVILDWEPSFLDLVNHVDNGPYQWVGSSFPNDEVFDGLNADCGPDTFCDPYTGLPFNDGDALYQALPQFAPNPPAFATPEGLLVTTIRFTALDKTELTELVIPASAGKYTETVILGGFGGEFPITGELGTAQITIVPEPTSLILLALGSVGLLRSPRTRRTDGRSAPRRTHQ